MEVVPMRMFAISLAVAALGVVDAAAQNVNPLYFQIEPTSVKVVDLGPVEGGFSPSGWDFKPDQTIALPPLPGTQDGLGRVTDIINVGARIWDIIKANKPVVDIKTTYASAVPAGVSHWGELSQWKAPQGHRFGLIMENKLGAKVVDVDAVVWRTTHGSYKGKGRYLTNVTVEPVRTRVLWGYTLDMTSAVSEAVNVGSAEDPIAALTVKLSYGVKNILQDHQGKFVFYTTGEGLFEERASPFGAMSKRISELGERLSALGPKAQNQHGTWDQ